MLSGRRLPGLRDRAESAAARRAILEAYLNNEKVTDPGLRPDLRPSPVGGKR